MEKSKGPRIEPWGTPHVRGVTDDEAFPKITVKVLSER